MIKIRQKGELKLTTDFLKKAASKNFYNDLNKYGNIGVEALASATPVDTGKTANSWYYEIENKNNKVSITWKNSNIVDGVPIAIIINYGHITGTGGYVSGYNYIEPAIKPVFDDLLNKVWYEVTR